MLYALMAMIRLNRPSVLVYGGTISSGSLNDKKLVTVSAFEAWGEKVAGTVSEDEYKAVIQNACPGAGACGGMYTANTMASSIEALGMSLGYTVHPILPLDRRKKEIRIWKSNQVIARKRYQTIRYYYQEVI